MGGSQLLPFLRSAHGVEAGTEAVPAAVGSDAYLFTMTGARSIEYPVSPAVAADLVQGLPPVGPVAPGGATPLLYTARPAVYEACTGSNCVLWAAERQRRRWAGRSAPPLRAFPSPLWARRAPSPRGRRARGRFVRFVQGVEAGEQAIAPAGAAGAPVAASMAKGVQVMKWGGRAFVVVGILTIPAEVALAQPGRRARTAVGATAGFAGGLAAGALAGLVCGPGAPVCSVVLGITFGIAGALGTRAVAEGIYDEAAGQ